MSFFTLAIIYITTIIGLSYFLSKRETREDFLIGERRLSSFPLAISLSTSWLGGGALSFMLYLTINDLPSFLFLALGCITNLFVMSFFVKKPYEMAKKNNWITMTEMANGVFGSKTGKLTLMLVLAVFSSWLVFELVGSGLILSNITTLSYPQSIGLMATAICLYLYFGGFKSLIRTDLIQYGLMIFMLVACLYLAQDVPNIDLSLYVVDKPSLSWKGFLAGFFGFFALQFVESTIWQRIFAAKSAGTAQRALIYTIGFYLLSYSVLISLIILGNSINPELQDEKLFAFISYEALPKWLGSLFMVSILGVIMSTIDTVLFISAQCFSTDFAHIFGKKMARPRNSIRLATITLTVVILCIALINQNIETIFWFVLALWGALVPLCYMFLPVKKLPSDKAVSSAMLMLAFSIIGLYLFGLYQDYYIAYTFIMGLVLPPCLDKFIFAR